MNTPGSMLRAARTARGVTLEQAERDTRIVRRYLEALENDDLSIFPAEVYARGFLRSYGSYLGISPEELMQRIAPAAEQQGAPSSPARSPARRAHSPGAPAAPALAVLVGTVVLGVSFLIGRLAADDSTPGAPIAVGGTGGAVPAPSGPNVRARMPDLVGLDEREALARLSELGVVAFVIEAPSRDAPAGQVLRQSPLPGTPIGQQVVVLVVSRGG